MLVVFVQIGNVVNAVHRAVDFQTLKALFAVIGDFLFVFAFSAAHDGGKQ